MAKADNTGWETDSRGNFVEVFNKDGVRDAFNEYMTTEFPGLDVSPLEAKLFGFKNIEQAFTNYDDEYGKYQMGYLSEYKMQDIHENTQRFVMLEMSVDLDDYNNSIENLKVKLSQTLPREISTVISYSYSYSNFDREYRTDRALNEELKEKLFGNFSEDEIIFEMYIKRSHGLGNYELLPMACITLENDVLTLRTGSISSSFFYDGWKENFLNSEVVGTDCINENGDRVCVINRGTPKPILTIGDYFYDAEDDLTFA